MKTIKDKHDRSAAQKAINKSDIVAQCYCASTKCPLWISTYIFVCIRINAKQQSRNKQSQSKEMVFGKREKTCNASVWMIIFALLGI